MNSSTLVSALSQACGAPQVLARPIDLVAYASDASVYRIAPKAIVRPRTIEDVQALFRISQQARVPLTFRAAGTSLSGQAITDGILADVARYWKTLEALDAGSRVRVGPGVVGAHVNRLLQPAGTKLGPDPASINACMMGGILANNSSGMCCGISQNAYRTLDAIRAVLPSGTVIDTALADAVGQLASTEPALVEGLATLRRHVLENVGLDARIRSKYRIKNTTGYSLNALVDYERPLDILAHLMIGSEGTLGFIAEAVLRTVPDLPVKYTGLLLFPTLREACDAIAPLRDAGASALELMDRAALRSVERQTGVPPWLEGLPDGATALLAEFQTGSERHRSALETAARAALDGIRLLRPADFTHEPDEQAALWRVRQGLYPSVGAARPGGTAAIIEDVAFPLDCLAEGVGGLTALFRKHDFDGAIVFGHAKDGNLHFVLTPSFSDPGAIRRYASFMSDLVSLVAGRYGGSLKAEHGTGRNMAPFVEAEWGEQAYAVMRQLKTLFDPDGLLNPGVIINDDPNAHLAHLKDLPLVHPDVDTCIECGYCEPVCPSREHTLTPRQRIVVQRELARTRAAGGAGQLRRALEADYRYAGSDTCAVDGLCALACPVGIDTGQLTKRLRSLSHRPVAHLVARRTAVHFEAAERLVRLGLRCGAAAQALTGARALERLTRAAGRVFGTPTWVAPMPGSAPGLPESSSSREAAHAVYFPSCLTRTMGSLPGEPRDPTLAGALLAVASRAGLPMWIPPDVQGACCGVPFSSKGYTVAHGVMIARTIERFVEWSDSGRLPIVVDTTPCTYGLRTCRHVLPDNLRDDYDRLRILDAIELVSDRLLPALEIRRRRQRVVLHPVCSATKLGLVGQLERIARTCAEEVVIPADAGCCAFAGDRGWLVPELTAAATRLEAEQARLAAADGHFSSSKTCETGMSRATGHLYRSHLFLLEWATRPEEDADR